MGKVNVLVATDVAARGLDLPGIDHVINYDLPASADDYVHRIGRTGRIGNTGIATTLVARREAALPDIVKMLSKQANEGNGNKQTELPMWMQQMAWGGGGGRGGGGRSRSAPGGYRPRAQNRSPSVFGGRGGGRSGGGNRGGRSGGASMDRGRSRERSYDSYDRRAAYQ